jgi:hypothetical protein
MLKSFDTPSSITRSQRFLAMMQTYTGGAMADMKTLFFVCSNALVKYLGSLQCPIGRRLLRIVLKWYLLSCKVQEGVTYSLRVVFPAKRMSWKGCAEMLIRFQSSQCTYAKTLGFMHAAHKRRSTVDSRSRLYCIMADTFQIIYC